MIIPVLAILFLVISLDGRLLRRENAALFNNKFIVSKSYLIGLILVLLLLLIAVEDKLHIVAVFFFIFLLPVYLIKRHRFLTALTERSSRFQMAADAFGVVLMWIFGGIVISIFVRTFFEYILQFESELGELMFSAGGSSILLIWLIYYASAGFSAKGFFHNVGLIKRDISWLKLIVLPSLVGLMFACLSALVIFSRKVTPQTPLSEIINATETMEVLMIFLAMAICIAPLVEEIVFRGYFYHVLLKLKGFKFALIFISLSFAVLHVGQYWGDWAAILMITVIGFVLTGLRAWTHSTIASAVMHYVYNGAVTVIPILMVLINNPAYLQYQAYYPQLSFHEKEELLVQALQKDADMAELHHELALIYLDEGRKLAKALEAINRALDIYPEDRFFLQTKALILERLGRYAQALEIRRKLLEGRREAKQKSKAF